LEDATFEHIVLNMSFIVAPCDIAAWFASGSPDAQKLLDLYNAKNGTKKKLEDLQKLLAGLKQPVAEWSKELGDFVRVMAGVNYDPVRQQLANDKAWDGFKKKYTPSSKPSVVAVGAAGNGIAYHDGATIRTERMPVPFAPAGWPGVLSVSATDGLTTYSQDAGDQFDGTMTYAALPLKGPSLPSPPLGAA